MTATMATPNNRTDNGLRRHLDSLHEPQIEALEHCIEEADSGRRHGFCPSCLSLLDEHADTASIVGVAAALASVDR